MDSVETDYGRPNEILYSRGGRTGGWIEFFFGFALSLAGFHFSTSFVSSYLTYSVHPYLAFHFPSRAVLGLLFPFVICRHLCISIVLLIPRSRCSCCIFFITLLVGANGLTPSSVIGRSHRGYFAILLKTSHVQRLPACMMSVPNDVQLAFLTVLPRSRNLGFRWVTDPQFSLKLHKPTSFHNRPFLFESHTRLHDSVVWYSRP